MARYSILSTWPREALEFTNALGRAARAHGGDVAFTPVEGGGSRFTVTLPIGR